MIFGRIEKIQLKYFLHKYFKRYNHYVLLLISSFLSLILFEKLAQHFLFPGAYRYTYNNFDHRMKPNGKDINQDGIRCRFEADHFKQDDCNIIMLGDSFVYGNRVNGAQTIPAVFESCLRKAHPDKRINVINFGWTSSSPLLSYRLLKDIGKKYHPKLVILGVDMTDFFDEIRYYKLIYENRPSYLLLKMFPMTLSLVKLGLKKYVGLNVSYVSGVPKKRYFVCEISYRENKHYYSYIKKSILAINAFCLNELNVPFMVVVFPRSYQYNQQENPDCPYSSALMHSTYIDAPFEFFDELEDEVDFDIFSLLPDFQRSTVFPVCFQDDFHWNASGNEIAAKAIFKYFSHSKKEYIR